MLGGDNGKSKCIIKNRETSKFNIYLILTFLGKILVFLGIL